ncbi:hypothetical protein [Paenibacillus ihbetae]|uniref:Lipoprotein n=1 Tax=Paenibacillus ihbetae TaxID=1870820 RepID=A0ABX3JUP5_9BACL|nr:hypothetical protein [Paenibacillus ihbetae]OOC59153.1 hypothetical protein BBD40_26325 [Paenibacillus ihbetae]
MRNISLVLAAALAVLVLGGCSGGAPEQVKETTGAEDTAGTQGLELSMPSAEETEKAGEEQAEPARDEAKETGLAAEGTGKGEEPAAEGPEPGDSSASAGSSPDRNDKAKAAGGDGGSQAPVESAPDVSLKDFPFVGKTMDDIRARLGGPKTTGKAGGTATWQYDFAKEGYRYPEKAVSVDVQGLSNGSMKEQLFVTFGEDRTVQSASLYYMTDGEIMEYRVTEDGAVEEPAGRD